MTRIITGSAGGRRLRTPGGSLTRPTSDRVREALFSALDSELGTWDGVRMLDLFAGSGAVGLEALSRGAEAAVLVEHDRRTAALIRANATDLGLDGAQVVVAKAETFVTSAPVIPYDVIFVDPPYAHPSDRLHELIAAVTTKDWWSPSGVVVLERPSRDREFSWPGAVHPWRRKAYGETSLWYGRSHA